MAAKSIPLSGETKDLAETLYDRAVEVTQVAVSDAARPSFVLTTRDTCYKPFRNQIRINPLDSEDPSQPWTIPFLIPVLGEEIFHQLRYVAKANRGFEWDGELPNSIDEFFGRIGALSQDVHHNALPEYSSLFVGPGTEYGTTRALWYMKDSIDEFTQELRLSIDLFSGVTENIRDTFRYHMTQLRKRMESFIQRNVSKTDFERSLVEVMSDFDSIVSGFGAVGPEYAQLTKPFKTHVANLADLRRTIAGSTRQTRSHARWYRDALTREHAATAEIFSFYFASHIHETAIDVRDEKIHIEGYAIAERFMNAHPDFIDWLPSLFMLSDEEVRSVIAEQTQEVHAVIGPEIQSLEKLAEELFVLAENLSRGEIRAL